MLLGSWRHDGFAAEFPFSYLRKLETNIIERENHANEHTIMCSLKWLKSWVGTVFAWGGK
jgi:hypothetical protein